MGSNARKVKLKHYISSYSSKNVYNVVVYTGYLNNYFKKYAFVQFEVCLYIFFYVKLIHVLYVTAKIMPN